MPARRPIFAANWKMNQTLKDVLDFMTAMLPVKTESKLLIFPPSVYLAVVAASARSSDIGAGAQDFFWERSGAYTGEISAEMVADCGGGYALVGHSERRHFFHESGETVAKKARAAQEAGLIPVICVGETLAERQSGVTMPVLQSQLLQALEALNADKELIIAYEPVWAIGTGLSATPEDAEEAIAYIRQLMGGAWGEVAEDIRILYGGSVKADNIANLMSCPNIDGALVGGASLKAASFNEIVERGTL